MDSKHRKGRATLVRSTGESHAKGVSGNYSSGGLIWSKPYSTPSAVAADTGTEDAQQVINTSQDVAQVIDTGSLQQLPRKFKVVI